MPSDFFLMEAVNLFCNDTDPQADKFLTLIELKLPTWQKKLEDHHPGGAPIAIEVGLGMEKLVPTFKLNGWDPDVLRQFGLGAQGVETFTAYGAIRNRRTGAVKSSKAIMRGSIGKIEGDAFQRGELQGHDHEINELTRYELYVGGEEMFFWDFFSNTLRVGGDDRNADINRALRIG